MSGQPIDLRIRHPKGNQVISTLYENSSIAELKREISKLSGIPPSRISFKLGYPPQKVDLPDNTILDNVGIQSGETIIAEENQDAGPVSAPSQTTNAQSQTQKGEKVETNLEQAPNPEGLIMIRRVIPADNSCLFSSIAYALENRDKKKAKDLRRIIATYINRDPTTYNEAILERQNDQYCQWILKDESWGGAIELEIFAKHYKVEICAVDISNIVLTVFGSGQNYKKRIYVLYDGIHYDILARNISEDMEESMDVTVFDPNDKYAYEGALTLAKQLNAKRDFTNLAKFTIQCGVCYKKFTGEKEAVDHNKETGHINFQEVTSA